MPIAGFNFIKISAERNEPKGTKISIENNIHLTNAEEISAGSKKNAQKAVKFTFDFISKFTQDLGKISLTSEVIYVDEEKNIKDILKEWKKDQKVTKDIMPEIMNYTLQKCNIEAIVLSREVNLPSPMPLPKIDMPGDKKE